MSKATALRKMAFVAKTEEELKVQKEMLDELLEEDEHLTELKDSLESIQAKIKAHKAALMNEPEAVAIADKIKEIAAELKEERQTLSDELLHYFVDEKSFLIEDDKGNEYRISFNGKAKQKGN